MSNKIDVVMDIQSGVSPSINSEEQGRNPLPTANSSRESSLVSSGHTTSYHERMDMNVAPEIEELNTESRELSYETEHERAIRVSTAANQQEPTRSLDGNNEAKSTHVQYEDDNINIQIPYDLNAPMEPELWSGLFHPISLHGSIEHFTSDSKNIKVTLNFLAKYILNKQVNGNMANDLGDFDSIGDAIWNFISAVYGAKWDVLFTDNKTNTLRAKISSKFTPRIPTSNGNNKKDAPKSSLVTINKAPPRPPLPARSKKEINTISKYFHTKKNTVENINQPSKSNSGKSYA